ncbi:relA-associated inhibitor isoform X1 [Mobula hypostoma]|uniref:relA-associated inhibitor isoform X1 n=2 Tax=Mobula hypostoma TaxID=723540 RepID=UPI002FC2D4DF
MLTTILLEQLYPHGVLYPCGRMADDQLETSSPRSSAFLPVLDSQTSHLLHSEQQKVNEAAFKLDKLTQELDSMWLSQGGPTSQEAVQTPVKDALVTAADPFGVSTSNKLGPQSQPGSITGVTRSSSKQPSQVYTPLTCERVSSPYGYDPLILPKQDQRSQSDRASFPHPTLGPQTSYSLSDWQSQPDRAPSPRGFNLIDPYSKPDQQSQLDRAPSPRPMLGSQTQYSQPDWQAPSDRAPSPRGFNLIDPYSKPEWRSQSDRAPSPRPTLGSQTQYSQPDWQSPSDRAPSPRGFNLIDPYSKPEWRSQSDQAPSPRPTLGSQTQYSQPDWQSPSDRAPSPRGFNLIDPYSKPEWRSPSDRAPSSRPTLGSQTQYSQLDWRPQSDGAPSPRGFNSLTPLEKPGFHSYHGQSPVCEPQSFSSSGVSQSPGNFSPSLSPFSGPAGSPEHFHGFSPRENVPLPYSSKPNFDTEDSSLTARTKPEFTPALGAFSTDPGKGDNLKPKKPASVWAEADLDVAYEKKPSKTPTQESKRDSNWNTTKQGGTWRQTDLDLAVPRSNKAAKGQSNANTIQLYGTLPKNGQALTVSPWWMQATHSKQRRANSSWNSPPMPGHSMGLFSVAPGSPRSSAIKERRNVLPLSVFIRPTIVSNWDHEVAPGWPRMGPPVSSDPRSPAQPQQGQEVASPMDMSEVEKEIASILPAGEGECEEGAPPRPLSPTRLQPMLLPGAEGVGNKEELLKIRATIPRALKKRSSIDQPPEERLPLERHTHQYQELTRIFRRRSQRKQQEGADEYPHTLPVCTPEDVSDITVTSTTTPAASPVKRTILKKEGRPSISKKMRARLSPLVVLLDAALLGELDVVQRIVHEIDDPSQSNDEGITALHNAVCGGHYNVVEFLVNFGVNVNVSDSHGWTPLHCAASCNDLSICTLLVRKGAAIFSMTLNDGATAADKCDAYLDGYEECYRFLFSAEQQAGMVNSAVLYALWDYEAENADELSFREGEAITILQRGNKDETYWWWASLYGREGYVPYNLLGLFPRVRPTA